MAIAFDTAASAGVSSTSLTYNSGAAAGGVGSVGIVMCSNDLSYTLTATWDGVAMTKLLETGVSGSLIDVFFLATIPAGAKSIVISASGSGVLESHALTYTGVSPNIEFDALKEVAFVGAGVGSISNNLTTVHDNAWVILSIIGNQNYTASVGAILRKSTAVLRQMTTFDSNAGVTPPSSYTMTVTRNGGGTGSAGYVMFSLQPYLTPPAAPFFALEMYYFPTAIQERILSMTATLTASVTSKWHNTMKHVSTWLNPDKS